MHAAPDNGTRITTGYESNSPVLRFQVKFIQTGLHYLWLRGYAQSDDNSAHAGLNGVGVASARNITFPVRNGWVWSNQAEGAPACLDVRQIGVQEIEIWMREDGLALDKIVLTKDSDYHPESVGPSQSLLVNEKEEDSTGSYMQSNDSQGLVTMEAENYSTKTDSDNHDWVDVYQPGGQGGPGAVGALPDIGERIKEGYESSSPALHFNVNFTKTGPHYIWLRGYCEGNDNSAHAGLNGIGSRSSHNITFKQRGVWTWTGELSDATLAVIDVTSTGMQTVDIWMREDGLILDKIILTTDPTYIPEGNGPQQSVID